MTMRPLAAGLAATALVLGSAGLASADSASSTAPEAAKITTRVAAATELPGGEVVGKQTLRVAGADRYGTSVEISKLVFDPAWTPVVFIASGETFPDALSAGPATFGAGPLLLTRHDSLPAVVATEIKRLQPCFVVVVGGRSSVSDAVAAQADALADASSEKCSFDPTDPGTDPSTDPSTGS